MYECVFVGSLKSTMALIRKSASISQESEEDIGTQVVPSANSSMYQIQGHNREWSAKAQQYPEIDID